MRAPKRERLSVWASEHVRLKDGSRYTPWPFQVGILDTFSNPRTRKLTFLKSARIGYTQMVLAMIGYGMSVSPCHMIYARPTFDEVEEFNKTELDPMLEWPILRGMAIAKAAAGKRADTLRMRRGLGWDLRLTAANTARAWAGYDGDWLFLDESSRYNGNVDGEGNPVDLAEKRQEQSWDPRTVLGSSPVEESSCITTASYRQSDRRRFYVPCGTCGVEQVFEFGNNDDDAPGIKWSPKNDPIDVWYRCVSGCRINESDKLPMMNRGRWIAEFPEVYERTGHAGFHINALYSLQPNASWRDIVLEFLAKRKNPNRLRTFINTTLGLPWEFRGDAPDWRRLADRREEWKKGIVPAGAVALFGGIDVQVNRVECFVWGVARGGTTYLVDHIVEDGSPYEQDVWDKLYATLNGASWTHENGIEMRLSKVAIDSGYATHKVYQFVRRWTGGFMVAVKGTGSPGAPPVDSGKSAEADDGKGKKKRRGIKLFMVGDHALKTELYGNLGIERPTEEELAEGMGYPQGYVHIPTWASEEHCKQLVAESYDPQTGKWSRHHANEMIDGWKYARVAALLFGVERWKDSHWAGLEATFGAAADVTATVRRRAIKAANAPKPSPRKREAEDAAADETPPTVRRTAETVHRVPQRRKSSWLRRD